jgi:Sec-independent protein translocase protein TatA
MFNLDPAKLLVIAIVGIILLGPNKLPQVAKQAGAAWRSFNEFRHRMESEVRNTMPDLPPTSEIARLARSPSALLHHLSTMSDEDEDKRDGEAPDGSFAPPGGATPEAAAAGAAAGAAATGPGDSDSASAAASGDGAGAPGASDDAVVPAASPPADGVAPPTSPAPTAPASPPPAPAPEVIAPGDPTLN